MFIGTDKISEIVNDSDSDGGSFNELSDSDTCKVNPPAAEAAAAAAAAAATAWKRKLFGQNLTKARREYKGPFLIAQIQILI